MPTFLTHSALPASSKPGKAINAVPAGAIFAVGEQPDGNDAEQAIDAVYRNGTHHVIDAHAVEEEDRFDDENARR